jgi:hypothetical protein
MEKKQMLIYSHHVVEANYYTSIVILFFHVQFLVLVTVAKLPNMVWAIFNAFASFKELWLNCATYE